MKILKKSGELENTTLESKEILNILQRSMFTSNVQRAGNDMVLQQYLTKMNNKFSSKMEAVTSENAFADFS